MQIARCILTIATALYGAPSVAQDLSVIKEAVAEVQLAACSLDDDVIVVGFIGDDKTAVGIGELSGMVVSFEGSQAVALGNGRVFVFDAGSVFEFSDGEIRKGKCEGLHEALGEVIDSAQYANAVSNAFSAAAARLAEEAQRKLSEREAILQVKMDRLAEKERAIADQKKALETALADLERNKLSPELENLLRELGVCEQRSN